MGRVVFCVRQVERGPPAFPQVSGLLCGCGLLLGWAAVRLALCGAAAGRWRGHCSALRIAPRSRLCSQLGSSAHSSRRQQLASAVDSSCRSTAQGSARAARLRALLCYWWLGYERWALPWVTERSALGLAGAVALPLAGLALAFDCAGFLAAGALAAAGLLPTQDSADSRLLWP